MIPARIDTHVVDGLDRLIEQYKDATSLKGLLTAYLNRIQEIEDALWEIIDERLLDNAVGVQLDIWGRIVKQPRTSDDDDVYRLYIRARILILRSKGRSSDLIAILFLLLGVDSNFRLRDVYPHQIRLWLDDIVEPSPADLAALLDQARAATITLRLLSGQTINRFRFRYLPNPSVVTKGFAFVLACQGDFTDLSPGVIDSIDGLANGVDTYLSVGQQFRLRSNDNPENSGIYTVATVTVDAIEVEEDFISGGDQSIAIYRGLNGKLMHVTVP